MIQRLFIFSLHVFCLAFLTNCNKKQIHKDHPEFIGNWSHHDTNGDKWRLEFGNKSWGTITVSDSTGKDRQLYGENGRNWRYNPKKQRLYNGIASPYFYVNQLPVTAVELTINGFDTIEAGETYCVINNDYFRKLPN